jgi:hypothetical protein
VILLGEQLTIDEIIGLALIIVGAEITLRGDSAKRAGGKAKAHEYRPHPPRSTPRLATAAEDRRALVLLY